MDDGSGAIGFLVSRAGARPGSGVGCPDENLLARCAESGTGSDPGERIEVHLAGCDACRALVAALAEGEDGAVRESVTSVGPPPEAHPTTAPSVPRAPGPGLPRPFGPYTIERLLGSGGMGVVYEARHAERRRPEALKVLKGSLGSVPDLVERFHREVRAMAGVSHDHILPLYDSGRVGDDLYYTMPLLPGVSLDEVVRRVKETGETTPGPRALDVLDRCGFPDVAGTAAPPSVAYARRIASALAGVADALTLLHERGILHRDLKPANLMLDGKGRVVVCDFGLARWNDPKLTRPGEALGTPAYMSPEQIVSDGREPDGRTDVYAFGATLFELLTLRLPHEGGSGIETIRRKLHDRVPAVRELNASVPRDLETLVGRCLERRRDDRVPSASALRDDLRRFASGETIRARPVSPLRRVRNYVALHAAPFAVAAVLLGGAAGWWWTRPAYLTVTTIPPARLLLDGKEVATTPLAAFRISAGEHEIRAEHPKFVPLVRKFTAERGATIEIDRFLRALDPADPDTLRMVAAGAGIVLSEVRVDLDRRSEPAPFTVLFPRGLVLDVPAEARLWADELAEGHRLRLERTGPDPGTISETEVPPSVRRRVVAFAEPGRARLVEGGGYRLVLVRADGTESSAAEFSIATREQRSRVEQEVERATRGHEPGDPAAEFLAVEVLLSEGCFEAAYDRAAGLLETVGPRKEVARAALAALDRAGLRDRGWWEDWRTVFFTEAR